MLRVGCRNSWGRRSTGNFAAGRFKTFKCRFKWNFAIRCRVKLVKKRWHILAALKYIAPCSTLDKYLQNGKGCHCFARYARSRPRRRGSRSQRGPSSWVRGPVSSFCRGASNVGVAVSHTGGGVRRGGRRRQDGGRRRCFLGFGVVYRVPRPRRWLTNSDSFASASFALGRKRRIPSVSKCRLADSVGSHRIGRKKREPGLRRSSR
eukprot:9503845-Pyramimonas_sp.AAC.1